MVITLQRLFWFFQCTVVVNLFLSRQQLTAFPALGRRDTGAPEEEKTGNVEAKYQLEYLIASLLPI